MAGNHRQTGLRPDRWILAAFVLIVGWATLHSWPTKVADSELVPRSAIRKPRLEVAECDTVPDYYWMQENITASLNQDSLFQDQEAEDSSFEEYACWQPVASEPMSLTPIKVDLPTLDCVLSPEQRWLKNRIANLQSNYPSWHWFPTNRWNAVSGLPFAWWQYRQQLRSRKPAVNIATRFASPPSLLSGPTLTSPHDRLAMRTDLPLDFAADRDTRSWDERFVDSARPWMSASLDRSLDQRFLAEPNALREMLCDIAVDPYARDWALGTLVMINRTVDHSSRAVVPTRQQLEDLAYMSLQAEQLAAHAPAPGLSTKLRRARYALWRRVEVWQAVTLVVSQPTEDYFLASVTDSGESSIRLIGSGTQVPVEQLLAEVEAYETSPTTERSALLSSRIAQLFEAPSLKRHQLATTLSDHYHNANARIAIADDFLNRWIPDSEPSVEPVNDRILGTPVRGQATTQMSTTVSLLPDPHAWRLGIEVNGQAHSSTVAFERTVRVRTKGTTNFAARQQVMITPRGIYTGNVVADANSFNRFMNARSDYDRLPIVGEVIRSKAAGAFSDRRRRAQREVSGKAENRVRAEMGSKVCEAVDRARSEWNTRVIEPLTSGGVAIEPVEMRTTEHRLIARARIVHGENLAAHTPRPRAPSDSLASLQVHESALTNLVSGMNLAGKRLTIAELVNEISKVAPTLQGRDLDKEASETIIEFADGTPVSLELADGKLHISWEIHELVVRGRATRDFKVHVYYVPTANGLVAEFAHQAGPYFEGKLRNIQRMRLQAIFGKVFPPEGQFEIGKQYADDPRLEGLMITQLVIDDGWLGMALGPVRETRTAQLDRYAPLWR